MKRLIMWDANQHRDFTDAKNSGALYEVKGFDLEEALQHSEFTPLWDVKDYFDSFCFFIGRDKDGLEMGVEISYQGFSAFIPFDEFMTQAQGK